LDLLTFDRITPSTISVGLLFFVFALKFVHALSPEDLEALYTRFVVECDDEAYWRAWWDGIRGVMGNLDNDYLRNTILSQIERTEWPKLYFYSEPQPCSACLIINNVTEVVREHTIAMRGPIPGWDFMPLLKAMRYMLREQFAQDVDDTLFRQSLQEYLCRIFTFYPATGVQRMQLAAEFFHNATVGPMESRGGDLQVLRALLLAETHSMVTNWKKEQCVQELCQSTPSLPGLILEELAAWKKRQYDAGSENAERPAQIQFRLQFLFQVLSATQVAGGFTFPRQVLEGFWNSALASSADSAAEHVYWGGDFVTENMRLLLFHILATVDFNQHSGLVCYPSSCANYRIFPSSDSSLRRNYPQPI